MKKRFLISLTAATLAVIPFANPLMEYQEVQAIEQQQSQQLVALGGSLDEQQAQQTLQLLGASQAPQSNIISVDGDMINRYLQDGSGTDTVVFSSASIQEMPEGYGVQVQIVTPQNITLVTPLTYQNAAITAGAKNVQIRIATVSPVTGEGALAGVYALMEQSGVAVNTEDVKVAQQEISLVNEIQQNAQVSNEKANKAIADIKTQIAQAIQEQKQNGNDGDVKLSPEQINSIVKNVVEQNNISNEAIIDLITKYAQLFSETEAAKSKDTIDQLESSMSANWRDVLNEIEGSITPEEALSSERLDFSDQAIYHPIIQAFADTFYQIIEKNSAETLGMLYNDTFIFEMMTPDLSNEEKVALNKIRSLIYQIEAQIDQEIQAGNVSSGYPSLKDEWLRKLDAMTDFDINHPIEAEIVRQIALTVGRAPQAFDYINPSQEGTVITYENSYVQVDHISDFTFYSYDVATKEIKEMDILSGEMIPANPINIGDKYGVTVENHYQPKVEIPSDFMIPGYVPEESSEETSETSEEVSEESSEELTMEPESSELEIIDESSTEDTGLYQPDVNPVETEESLEGDSGL